MSIRLNVKKSDRKRIAELGAILLQDGKTWVIPDTITDINRFMPWLPATEGHIVQRPYFSVRAKWPCWKCGQETPIVGLGARAFQSLEFQKDNPVWIKDEGPLLYTEIQRMDDEVAELMKSNYPFFQKPYSGKLRKKQWGNCCVHCGTLQEEDDDYRFDFGGPFFPDSAEAAREIRIIYFKLQFDYYIDACYGLNPFYLEIFK
ncbi:hypothetical protein [Puia dinghuensis]|uniref:Uncharacterized protein n=1 Tax=Puia dinghuensis TaxID=1792502 RepID=A0A8J2XV67_9BACT|nr:hypothetical protein [Puia dinghuensis]GGB14862.1 hypothetical protein GCM10011511_43260 [Puia dinghuensis]